MVELLNLGLERILARPLQAGRRINIGRHVQVVGPGLGAGFEHRVIDRAGAGIEGDIDLMLLEKLSQVRGLHGVDLMDLEAALLGALVESAGESRVNVRQDDALETVVPVELHPDHAPHSPHAHDHCVCH